MRLFSSESPGSSKLRLHCHSAVQSPVTEFILIEIAIVSPCCHGIAFKEPIFLSGIICHIIALIVHSISKYGILRHSINITVITWLIFGSLKLSLLCHLEAPVLCLRNSLLNHVIHWLVYRLSFVYRWNGPLACVIYKLLILMRRMRRWVRAKSYGNVNLLGMVIQRYYNVTAIHFRFVFQVSINCQSE